MSVVENREYKSDVFTMLMEEPENALEVYNVLNHTDFKDAKLIEMCRLKGGVSLSMRNDAAFIIDMNVNIWEHQSTYCPNMPLRTLFYITEVYQREAKNEDIYGSKLIKLPNPKFVVFYNGESKRPPIEKMKLSMAYAHEDKEPELELVVTVYNINLDKENEVVTKSTVLHEYMLFVDKVKEYILESGIPVSEENKDAIRGPISKAIDYCIENNILVNFLKRRREEVLKNMVIDMTFERRIELVKRDSKAEGRDEGREEGHLEGMVDILRDYFQSAEEILSQVVTKKGYADITLEDIEKCLNAE